MDEVYVRVLNKNRIFMRDKISDVHGILDHLVGNEIIRNDHLESIISERTPSDRKRRMIDILVKCMPKNRMFDTFCLALGEEGFDQVKETLLADFEKFKEVSPTTTNALKQVPASSLLDSPPGWLTRELAERQVTEKEIALVSKNIGAELEYIGLAMGFSHANIHQFRMYTPYNPAFQVLKMLSEWRSRELREATVGNLIAKLREGGVDESVIEEVFANKTDH